MEGGAVKIPQKEEYSATTRVMVEILQTKISPIFGNKIEILTVNYQSTYTVCQTSFEILMVCRVYPTSSVGKRGKNI